MGVWGTEIFDDDESLNYVCEIEEMDNLFLEFTNVLNGLGKEELEFTESIKIIVIACVIDTAINGTRYEVEEEGFYKLKDKISLEQCDELKKSVLSGVDMVLTEKSWLYELWSEAESFLEWKKNVSELRARLSLDIS